MKSKGIIFSELIKRGRSLRGETRVWDISDSKLWFLTPELVEGFLNLRKFEPYKNNVIAPEIKLIEENSSKIFESAGYKKFNLIDLSCEDGVRAEAFIKNLPSDVSLRYCPVELSPYLVSMAVKKIGAMKTEKIKGIKECTNCLYEMENVVGELRNGDYPNNVCLLLGSVLSTYQINDLLYHLSEMMFPNDYLIIGNGVREGERFVGLEKYQSIFFENWFVNILYALGFKEGEVEYDARFANGRVEGFFVVNTDKVIKHKDREVKFRKGDEIIVAVQYKYYINELKEFCEMYFRKVDVMPDSKGEYVLISCVK